MSKHDFSCIVGTCSSVALAAAIATAGCSSTATNQSTDSMRRDGAVLKVSGSGSDSDTESDDAGFVSPTLTELKHFDVYRHFHGLDVDHDAATSPAIHADEKNGVSSDVGFACLPSVDAVTSSGK